MIPYFICCIVGGIPLFYLEVCVGQFMGVAGLNAWKICPIFQGNFENLLKNPALMNLSVFVFMQFFTLHPVNLVSYVYLFFLLIMNIRFF